MDTGITIAIVGLLGTIGGVIGTLFTTRWQLNTEREQHDDDQLIEFYKTELAHARSECDHWRDLALRNLGTMEAASETLTQLNTTTGGTS